MTKPKNARKRRYAKDAAKCHDGKIRDAVASKWTAKAQKAHDARKMGTFGAASPVRRIDPSEYGD